MLDEEQVSEHGQDFIGKELFGFCNVNPVLYEGSIYVYNPKDALFVYGIREGIWHRVHFWPIEFMN